MKMSSGCKGKGKSVMPKGKKKNLGMMMKTPNENSKMKKSYSKGSK